MTAPHVARLVLEAVLTLILLTSWVFWMLAAWSARRFLRRRPEPDSESLPAVSILKPLKGADHEAYENFASFCRQDYPEIEILFGVADAADPAIAVVARLRRDFPEIAIRVLVAGETAGNPKSGILVALQAAARHEVLVVSDSDVRASPDCLRRIVAPLADPRTSLVSCLYRSRLAATLASRFESLFLDAGFLPAAIVAYRLGRRFGVGATMAVRRAALERIDGFAAFSRNLLDDYEIGARLAARGEGVVLSREVVTHVLGAGTWRELWDREVRWSRGIRAARLRDYAGLPLTFSTPAALLLAVAAGLSPLALAALAGSLLLRFWVALRLYADLGGEREPLSTLAWLPLRDCLSAVVWCAGCAGRRVRWRGSTYRLEPGGLMTPEPSEP
ncbi:MAG TPA: bacteriohopanetetrol glucosamine biosynthesis glycosyltransferase HpnI [Thermoanaerobaculia bacterium]|nr:bacteriohopanetetrol glucosamine biosynthesis glycosyltransferase HpnI [Thermoanaerobaculia bacterium]